MGVTCNRITVEGHSMEGVILNCGHLVDYPERGLPGEPHLLLHPLPHDHGRRHPHCLRRELVADLKEVSLKEAIVRQFRKAAEVMEARLNSGGDP